MFTVCTWKEVWVMFAALQAGGGGGGGGGARLGGRMMKTQGGPAPTLLLARQYSAP